MGIDINNPEDGNKIVSPDNLHTDPLPEGQESWRVEGPEAVATQVPTSVVEAHPVEDDIGDGKLPHVDINNPKYGNKTYAQLPRR